MRSKNAPALTIAEREHLRRVKELPCSVCGTMGPSDAHHIEQRNHWCVVALCKDCHQGALNGWHGQKRSWLVLKMNEIGALAVTIRRLSAQLAAMR